MTELEKEFSKLNLGLKRNTIDKFYTKTNVAKDCIEKILKNIDINKNDFIIEPSAGNGRFTNELEIKFENVLSLDILPENEKIKKQDYLTYEIEDTSKNIHIIGNPPFGKQSSIAKKFIKKSCSFAKSISFILPKSFKKESFQKVFDLQFHLIFSEDLPKNSFTVNDIEHDVPCVFQIWIKKEEKRVVMEKIKETNYTFIKKNDEADFSLRRVGVYAGKLSQDVKEKSLESHYFIKLNDNKLKEKFEEEYNKSVTFEHNNTVGAKSISKEEFKKVINEIIQKITK